MRPRAIAAVVLAMAIAGSAVGGAQATTILDPIIRFDAKAREATVQFINDAPHELTYRISIVNLRQSAKDGSWSEVETPAPGELFAREFLRFSPRQVTVPAGQHQTVRLLLNRPVGLPRGEYHSFLRISELPPPDLAERQGMRLDIYMTQQLPITVIQD